jgi:hypothetical protein
MVCIAGEEVMQRIVPVLALCVLLVTVGTANAQSVRHISESRDPVDDAVRAPTGPVTASVDCTRGQSINKALKKVRAQSDTEFVIEIHGICDENVVLQGIANVTLRGTNPELDGIRGVGQENLLFPYSSSLLITDAHAVRIESLLLTGWRPLRIYASSGVHLVNCALYGVEGGRQVVWATHSSGMNFTDTTVSSPDSWGLIALWSDVNLTDTTVSAGVGGVYTYNGSAGLNGVTASAHYGLAALGAADVTLTDSVLAPTSTGIFNDASAVWAENSPIGSTTCAVRAGNGANVGLSDSEISGCVSTGGNAYVLLAGITQTATDRNNLASDSSTINVWLGSQLSGPIELHEFSNAIVHAGGTVLGDLFCYSGSDAYCEDPANVGHAYGCPSTPGFAVTEPAMSSSDSNRDFSRVREELRSLMEEERHR